MVRQYHRKKTGQNLAADRKLLARGSNQGKNAGEHQPSPYNGHHKYPGPEIFGHSGKPGYANHREDAWQKLPNPRTNSFEPLQSSVIGRKSEDPAAICRNEHDWPGERRAEGKNSASNRET